jgi:hypothetical protein
MATAPLICKADLANTLIEGGQFNRCTFQVTKDSSVLNSFDFCDFSLDIDDFFAQSLKLKGGSAFLLDDSGLSNSFGEVKALIISVKYPSSFTTDSSKYINLIYEGKVYPIGNFHIWTGEPGSVSGRGISIFPIPSITDPLYNEGGVVLHNPHANDVEITTIVASGGTLGTGTSGTSGTSSNPTTSGTSGSSGSSGSSGATSTYFGTSTTLITLP